MAEEVARNEAVGQFTNLGVGLGTMAGSGGTVAGTVGGAMNDALNSVKEKAPVARLESIYSDALARMEAADSEEDYKTATAKFFAIENYKDSSARREKCLNEAEVCRKDAIYNEAKDLMSENIYLQKSGYQAAIPKFQAISGWRDADEQIEICKRTIEEIEQEEEKNRIEKERQARQMIRRKRLKLIIIAAIICAVFAIMR